MQPNEAPHFILRPRYGVTSKHADGVYMHRYGEKLELIAVGSAQGRPEDLASSLSMETGEQYAVSSVAMLPGADGTEEIVRQRGFMQVILDCLPDPLPE